jgi:sugar phosphate isomerase/epimerase
VSAAAIPGHTLTAQGQSSAFRISLAQWSVNRRIFGQSIINLIEELGLDGLRSALRSNSANTLKGDLTTLDFPTLARQEFGIDAVEYVNTLFFDKGRDEDYLTSLRRRAADEGVRNLLIMCDLEGRLGDPDSTLRRQSVEDHFKWVDAAAFLGCHSVRVNALSEGTRGEQLRLVADGLHQLCEYADSAGINVLIENHGGLSSDGGWVLSLMKATDHPRVGTLPDFGNFQVTETERYDPYQGVTELMPFARAVSAKAYDFDDSGEETALDYRRLMRIILDAGYRGYVGIEYEGDRLSEMDGIRATKALLERIRDEVSDQYV